MNKKAWIVQIKDKYDKEEHDQLYIPLSDNPIYVTSSFFRDNEGNVFNTKHKQFDDELSLEQFLNENDIYVYFCYRTDILDRPGILLKYCYKDDFCKKFTLDEFFEKYGEDIASDNCQLGTKEGIQKQMDSITKDLKFVSVVTTIFGEEIYNLELYPSDGKYIYV